MIKILSLCIMVLLISLPWAIAEDDQRKFQYDSKGKRDPFIPIDERVQESETIELIDEGMTPAEKLKSRGIHVNSIVWDATSPVILVGDNLLEVGQSIQGVIIRAIERDFVVFEVDGELVEVPLS